MFEDDITVHDLGTEDGAWYHLTDQYAAALGAMERGEPDARRRVLAAYQKLLRGPWPPSPRAEST